ncbi:MAG: hypothetical protein HKN23_17110 [Verrucomicrobiales bacterium]|nr:hypothetical protein [Verrucomicrobiales bacterium]
MSNVSIEKVVISIGGALIGHFVLFVLILVFLMISALMGPPGWQTGLRAEPQPIKEVTISFSELMEKMKVIPPETVALPDQPKPDDPAEKIPEPPVEPDKPQVRPFIPTFADEETQNQDRPAKFQSDRNTDNATAALNLDPDGKRDMPTLKGDEDIPLFHLRDRKFIDGEFGDHQSGGMNSPLAPGNPAPPTKTSPDPFREKNKPQNQTKNADTEAEETDPDSPPDTPTDPANPGEKNNPGEMVDNPPNETESPPVASAENLKLDADPAEKPEEAPPDADPENPANALKMPDQPGENPSQPEADAFAANPRMEEAEKSFVVPNRANAPIIGDNPGPKDQSAIVETDAPKVGPPEQPETPRPASAAMPNSATAPLPPPAAATMPATPAGSIATLPPNPDAVQATQPIYRPEMLTSRVKGTISNLKKNASVAADETPLGKYQRQVYDAIGRKWHRYRLAKADFMTWGTMKIKFRVDHNGKVRDLEMVENKTNTVMGEFTLRAVLDAEIPRMPQGIQQIVGPQGLTFDYDVIIH